MKPVTVYTPMYTYTHYENNKEGTTETVQVRVHECLFNGYEIETKRAIVITVHIIIIICNTRSGSASATRVVKLVLFRIFYRKKRRVYRVRRPARSLTKETKIIFFSAAPIR